MYNRAIEDAGRMMTITSEGWLGMRQIGSQFFRFALATITTITMPIPTQLTDSMAMPTTNNIFVNEIIFFWNTSRISLQHLLPLRYTILEFS